MKRSDLGRVGEENEVAGPVADLREWGGRGEKGEGRGGGQVAWGRVQREEDWGEDEERTEEASSVEGQPLDLGVDGGDGDVDGVDGKTELLRLLTGSVELG